MKRKKLFIGIDPGKNTGFAAWDPEQSKFLEVSKYSFWDAIDKLTDYLCSYSVQVVIEDPNQNPSIHFGKIKSVDQFRSWLRVAQNIGMNKRDAQLWIDYCEWMNISYATVRPNKKSLTKMKAPEFNRLTKWKERSNEHGRDAGMLVFGMK